MRLTLLLLIILVSACDSQQLLVIKGNTMGTTYMVKVVDAGVDEKTLKAGIESELLRLNQLMSTYIDDSELSRLNRAEVNRWIELSEDTMAVIRAGLKFSRLSAGSFDMTVGPLVNLWGFGPGGGGDAVPSKASIRAARDRVGYQLVEVRDNALWKQKPVAIDLSAIAKGYGVDQIATLLEKHQISHYLIEIGGELRAKGRNERGTHWRIAIERPVSTERSPFTTLPVNNFALATSGDYRNYFEVDGLRYSHTIDPKTGKPITHRLASVSVLAESALLADGWATAFNVMGPEAGMALAEEQNVAALFIIKDGEGFREALSSAFLPYISNIE
jgi:thiamine biosynthesis lipoprotein